MTVIEVFLWGVVFFGIYIMQRRAMAQHKLEIDQAVDKHMTTIRIVSIEQHGNIEYWFDKNNSEFIAQGANLDEIISHAKSRFPDHTFFFNLNEQWFKVSEPDWKIEKIKVVDLTKNN